MLLPYSTRSTGLGNLRVQLLDLLGVFGPDFLRVLHLLVHHPAVPRPEHIRLGDLAQAGEVLREHAALVLDGVHSLAPLPEGRGLGGRARGAVRGLFGRLSVRTRSRRRAGPALGRCWGAAAGSAADQHVSTWAPCSHTVLTQHTRS